ncbi:transposase [Streptomyces sp. NPDC015127]|uniref:transposase n=1 Tax=Streptomyces sp. NPDC015127 TaxID=3364939 RepID=UPI0036FFFAEF
MPVPREYPDGLRERAVREVQTSGRPIAQVARDLGMRKEALRQWVCQAEADQGDRPDLLTTAERAELAQLRKKIAELRWASEILKAASVFFAKELDQPCTRPTR